MKEELNEEWDFGVFNEIRCPVCASKTFEISADRGYNLLKEMTSLRNNNFTIKIKCSACGFEHEGFMGGD